MPNIENLKPGGTPGSYQLTREQAKKGQAKSVETKKRKKLLRECLEELMNMEITGKNGETMTGAEAMAAKAFQKALKGDLRAFELVRDTSGQKPVEKVAIADVDPSVIDEVERMVKDDQE